MTEISPKKSEILVNSTQNTINLNETTKNMLKIDTESLNKKFFNTPFEDLTMGDHQKMYNQFSDILKLVDEFKKENASLVTNSPMNSKLSMVDVEELKSPFPSK
jgi:hypothetical protein